MKCSEPYGSPTDMEPVATGLACKHPNTARVDSRLIKRRLYAREFERPRGMRTILMAIMSVATTSCVFANVHETVKEVEARYGKPVRTLESSRGTLVCYKSGGFNIGVVYTNGISSLETFINVAETKLTEVEIATALSANSGGHKWKLDPQYPLYRYRDDFRMMVSFGRNGKSLVFQDPTAGTGQN